MFITRHSGQRSYGVEFRAYGPNVESDGIVCFHCGAEELDVGPHCTCCDKFICRACVGKGCMPLEARLDAWERMHDGRKYLRKERLFDIFRASGGI